MTWIGGGSLLSALLPFLSIPLLSFTPEDLFETHLGPNVAFILQMVPKSPPAGVAEKLVFGSSLEETVVAFPPAAGSSTADVQDGAEARVSMYVSLFEGASSSAYMLAGVYSLV